MTIFTIDGNIGAGKSTLLDYLHNHYHLAVDPEPVQKWQPFLEDMYRTGKGAFDFQVRVWLDRCWIQQRPNSAPLIMERSPHFQSNVFVPANLENGKITLRQFHTLSDLYTRSSNVWLPDGYIYLRSNPLKCLERIRRRGRISEETLTEQYISKLHVMHEMTYMNAVALGIPIICIDIEDKTVPQIAGEVWVALNILGLKSGHNIAHDAIVPVPPPPSHQSNQAPN